MLRDVWQMPYPTLRRGPYRGEMHDPSAGMVGRADERARLRAAAMRAAAGTPSFVLVVGEAGIGKSRLLRTLASEVTEVGLRPLAGTAIESGGALPFLPLIAPLRVATGPQERADPAMSAVRRLVRGVDGGDEADAASAARLLESIFEVLTRRPTALIVDDVQWADASTITVLDHLAHRAVDVPLLVVAAARDDDPSLLDRLPIADGRRYGRLRLERLSPDDIASQVASLVGRPPDARTLARIYARTDGNPFFVEQVVEASDGRGGFDALPSTLRTFVQRRLGRADPMARAALDALAVVGRRADDATVAAVASSGGATAAEDVPGALRDAVAHGIAVADADGTDLAHPLFREVLLEELARPLRARLHAGAAEVLAAAGRPATEVADHWWRAGDPVRAWASALLAADVAEAALAFPEVRLHLERAVERWPDDEAGRVEAMLRLARACWLEGDAATATTTVLDAEAIAGEPTVALMIARGAYAWDAGERRLAAEAFERALDLTTEATPTNELAIAHWGLGRARIADRHVEEAVASAHAAARLAAEAGDRKVEANAWALSGMSRAFDESLAGIPELERSLTCAIASGDPSAVGHGYQFLVDLLGLDGQVERASTIALEGIEACDRLGLARWHASDLRGRAGLLLIELGRWPEADAVLGPAEPRAFPLLARALLAIRRGDPDQVDDLLAAAETGGSIGGPGALGGWHELVRVERAWLARDPARARAILASLPPVAGVWGLDVRARAAAWQARVADVTDDQVPGTLTAVAAAEPDRRLAEALVAEIAIVRARSTGTAAVAVAAAGAAAAWERAARPFERGWASLVEATAWFAAGERDAARAAMYTAGSIAAALGSAPLSAAVDDLARRARVSAVPVRRAAAGPDALTEREHEVLLLVAEGSTNREIADRLFLSPKTVGIHVSRVLAKLDAHTRGEAVAIARRRGLLD
jgi:DNA-binding NarL/FixJ family response regulator/tetratricopeptide (TPR) repeat protein